MYFALLPEEKKYFLGQIDIILDIDDDASNISRVTYFTIKVKQSIIFEENVLEGRFIKYPDFLVVQEFKPVQYSQLSNYTALFEVLCYEAIEKLKKFTKLYSQRDLRIFSTNSTIIDQMFAHGGDLEKINAVNIAEVMAKFKL